MPPRLIYLGVDIHHPAMEMAAKLVETLRSEVEIESAVLSIQSFKKVEGADSDTVVLKRGFRLLQLTRLIYTLLSPPLADAAIWHFVGNGNRILFTALAIFARFKNKKLCISSLGNCWTPAENHSVQVIYPHERMNLRKISEGIPVISPASSLAQVSGQKSLSTPLSVPAKLLFSSVPPHSSEFTTRGLPLFVEVAASMPESIFIILNRHRHLVSELEKLVKRSGATNVRIETNSISDMGEYLKGIAIVFIGSAEGALPQVPLSVIEGFSQGVPCLVPNTMAISDEVKESGSGETFSDRAGAVAGARKILADYAKHSAAALSHSKQKYSAIEMVRKYGSLYKQLMN